MSTPPPKRIHTVTAGYIRRFARRGVVVRNDISGSASEKGVSAVGYQVDYWGPPDLSLEVEESLERCESQALRVLRDIEPRWPLSKDDRGLLAEFISIHVIRTPAFGAYVRGLGEEAIEAGVQRSSLSPEQVSSAIQVFRGPRMHANTLLRQINRIGSLLASMQWILLRFDHDYLITSDQPVVLLPVVPGPISPASSVPATGFANTIEVRFTLDPQHALLMTWADAGDMCPVEGTHRQACSINQALRNQSLEEWFSRPGSAPVFVSPPVLRPEIYAISTELVPGYSNRNAALTMRKQRTEEMIAAVIQRQDPPDYMRYVEFAAK